MKKLYLIFVCILLVAAPLYYYLYERNIPFADVFEPGVPVIKIGDVPVRVEVVRTEEERIKGLSRRTALSDTIDGMLFVFPTTERHGIWMKEMYFPIDIIWIGEDGKVVHIEKNVDPNTYPNVYRPPVAAKYVLETEVHFSDSFNIYPGLTVSFPEAIIENN